jgi:predicted alpha/beta-fold hydrolase
MLPQSCYPIALAKEHPYIYLEMPEFGGHVGFSLAWKSRNWAEQRALQFIEGEE